MSEKLSLHLVDASSRGEGLVAELFLSFLDLKPKQLILMATCTRKFRIAQVQERR